MRFIEIGMEEGHVHMLVQGIPTVSVSAMVRTIKSITARKIYEAHPRLRKEILWGGEIWTKGHCANTAGQYVSRETITKYIQNQGNRPEGYEEIYSEQLEFDFGV